ncbi:MAG: tRNA lysidine(34) synthetase TilS [Bacteroidales bacterium]|nr:tRNA lysidine(34) synthetase TilS [Bacteroidales bacterium]
MQRRFADTMTEMRGLINEWSAPSGFTGESEADVLLAVSGGIDSMCMAELFAALEPRVPFAMAHCNFHLRAEESDGDEALVRAWASEHGVRIHVRDFDTETYAREKGISIEMAARDLRYAWFAELCLEHGYKAVSVAHNANDNAETLILNMLRGAGLRGLSGMSFVSSVPGFPSIPLLRPLLDCTRKQIEGYMFAHKVPYREDSTNAMSDYKRNRIRNEAFPIFETVNPSFVRTVNREMGYFSEAGEIVEDWCRSMAPSVVEEEGEDLLRVDTEILMANAHWRYLLYYILEPYGFNSAVLASVEDLLASSRTIPGKRFESQEYEVLTGRGELLLRKKVSENAVDDSPVYVNPRNGAVKTSLGDSVMPVRGAGTYHFNGQSFKVEVLDRTPDMTLKQPEGVLIMDADKLRFPFVLRRWRSGDWLVPFGMRGKKKVSDLFTDLKYDALQKDASVMIVDTCAEGMAESQHISAVVGVRIDDRYKVLSDTRKVVRISGV